MPEPILVSIAAALAGKGARTLNSRLTYVPCESRCRCSSKRATVRRDALRPDPFPQTRW
jgi:hypothetical protein